MLKEFREFALRGNVADMAVGVIIGVAFGAIVKSLVDDILMPPLGMLIGNMDFANLFMVLKAGSLAGPYASLEAARAAGAVTVNYGLFVNAVVSFLLVALAVFMVVRQMNRLKKKEVAPAEPTTRDCPYCLSSVPLKAVRCRECTSELEAT